jgi:hypothetical protein
MLLHLEGAIRPDVAPVRATENTLDISDAEAIAEAVAALRARVADAQASLAMAHAAARINRAEVARLASVIRLREELAAETATLAAAGPQPAPARTSSIRQFVNAGEAALGGLSAASIVFGAITTFAA